LIEQTEISQPAPTPIYTNLPGHSRRAFFIEDTMTAPILRWPGGKRSLLKTICAYLPDKYGTVFEPFVGGGALTFDQQPHGGFISDVNAELINFYTVVKQNPAGLAQQIQCFDISTETFYTLRAADRLPRFQTFDPVWRAARYLYMNRTCFNGMMRVTKQGWLTCSIGGPLRQERVHDTDSIWAAHEALQATRIYEGAYQKLESLVKSGDFIYFDPPYVPVRVAGDISYTANELGLNEQAHLAQLCGKLTKIGVKWMLSNSSVDFIHLLYGHYTIHEIETRHSLSGRAKSRGKAREVLITNYR